MLWPYTADGIESLGLAFPLSLLCLVRTLGVRGNYLTSPVRTLGVRGNYLTSPVVSCEDPRCEG